MDVKVPVDNLLGEEGRGIYQALPTLEAGRISIAACCVGLAQAALDATVRYIDERQTFGKKLWEHQAVQMRLADMATQVDASRVMLYYAAWQKDTGKDYNKIAGMAKLLASEVSEKAAYDAIQLHGGYGYSAEFPVERIYRDQQLMTIGEGANDILRMVIARRVMGH
ncbi:MAG: acyl-CoA dehydrogenase family protein [Anaerolineae bacterium]